jgi:malonate decarboxylase gamma subunit
MTLADILTSLFPAGHAVRQEDGLLRGEGALGGVEKLRVIGVAHGTPLGVEGALALASDVLGVVRAGGGTPILVLIDSSSQRMSRHDELMGLNEYLAHLAKSLLLAEAAGHRTIGLLYGGSAAGAFIATALSCETLLALPAAHPAVMDLPSMARVTKLPIETLETMAKVTPVFAPGLENLAQTGAIHAVLDPSADLAVQVRAHLSKAPGADARGALGAERGGRVKAAAIAARVQALASA